MGQNSSQRSSATVWTLSILVTLFVYILSFGPVVRFTEDKSLPGHLPEWVNALYFPVYLLHDDTPLKEPLEWYRDLWVKKSTPP